MRKRREYFSIYSLMKRICPNPAPICSRFKAPFLLAAFVCILNPIYFVLKYVFSLMQMTFVSFDSCRANLWLVQIPVFK